MFEYYFKRIGKNQYAYFARGALRKRAYIVTSSEKTELITVFTLAFNFIIALVSIFVGAVLIYKPILFSFPILCIFITTYILYKEKSILGNRPFVKMDGFSFIYLQKKIVANTTWGEILRDLIVLTLILLYAFNDLLFSKLSVYVYIIYAIAIPFSVCGMILRIIHIFLKSRNENI